MPASVAGQACVLHQRKERAMQMQRWAIAIAAAVVLALGLMPGSALAQVRVDPQQVPFYARIVTGTGEWTPVIFYRPTGCIPQNFNLERFFDPPRVFACGPMTVESFAIWENGPGLDPAPRHARTRGLGAVPIWFVRTEDYLAAIDDGVLTIGELEALDPLMGYARQFTETLHPEPPVQNSVLVANAKGTLQDGRSFRLHITLQTTKDHRLVQVHFGG
jgi:hypothetical protein